MARPSGQHVGHGEDDILNEAANLKAGGRVEGWPRSVGTLRSIAHVREQALDASGVSCELVIECETG